MKKRLLLVLALLFLVAAGCGQNRDQVRGGNQAPKELVLAAGQNNGDYGTLGGELVKLYNGDGRQPLLRETGGSGSVANVELLAEGRADLAFVQSDVADAAVNGTDQFAGKPMENLQVLGVLYPETVQIITYDVTGIRKLADLRGRTLAVGAAGSGSAYDARKVLEAAGIPEDEVRIQYLSVEDEVRALKEGTVDAAFVTSGVPHQAFRDLARQRQLVLVPVEGGHGRGSAGGLSPVPEDRDPGGNLSQPAPGLQHGERGLPAAGYGPAGCRPDPQFPGTAVEPLG